VAEEVHQLVGEVHPELGIFRVVGQEDAEVGVKETTDAMAVSRAPEATATGRVEVDREDRGRLAVVPNVSMTSLKAGSALVTGWSIDGGGGEQALRTRARRMVARALSDIGAISDIKVTSDVMDIHDSIWRSCYSG
jgi:hypothetical protein